VEEKMKRRLLVFAILGSASLFAKEDEATARINEAAKVFQEIMGTPDKGIPRELLDRAQCIGIVPGMKKAGFVIGGQYGKGVLTCRTANGWSGPSTIRIEGGSFGAQIGGGEVDVVMVVMNKRGAEKLMKSEFTIGGEAGAMAGPVGRNASANTDAYMQAEILSYSRARGAFAGATLNGSTLRSDDKDNQAIYGKAVSHEEILMGKVKSPAVAAPLMAALRPYVGKGTTGTKARQQ